MQKYKEDLRILADKPYIQMESINDITYNQYKTIIVPFKNWIEKSKMLNMQNTTCANIKRYGKSSIMIAIISQNKNISIPKELKHIAFSNLDPWVNLIIQDINSLLLLEETASIIIDAIANNRIKIDIKACKKLEKHYLNQIQKMNKLLSNYKSTRETRFKHDTRAIYWRYNMEKLPSLIEYHTSLLGTREACELPIQQLKLHILNINIITSKTLTDMNDIDTPEESIKYYKELKTNLNQVQKILQ